LVLLSINGGDEDGGDPTEGIPEAVLRGYGDEEEREEDEEHGEGES
jgi:hypothetical protein